MLSQFDARKAFINICRRAFLLGLQVSAGGNITCRIGGGLFLVKPSGVSLFDLKEQDILVADEEGLVVEGQGNPTKEFPSHVAIYRIRQDVGAVVHYHPPYATSFAVRGQEIPLQTVHAKRILQKLPVVGPAQEGGSQLAKCLEAAFATPEVRAAIMLGHGVIAAGKGLMEAQNIAELVEETARIAFISEFIQPRGEDGSCGKDH